MKATLAKVLPGPVRTALRAVYLTALDGWDALRGARDPLVPPRRMNFVGDGDFKRTGQEFLKLFRDLGGLKEEDRVLDVGSGIGRMAVPLAPFLKGKGSYDGLEIVKKGVDWCAANITPRHPRLRFHWVDVYNFEYNPTGRIPAVKYRFPFPDASFDFIFLTSVFTHMLPPDLENYLGEIARVLAPGGRLFATFFLQTPESLELVRKGASSLDMRHEGPGYLTVNPDMPECAIAFPEAYVLDLLRKRGLQVREPVRYGAWCGRSAFTSYQDIVLAMKT